jgi:hypothetical protein
MVWLPMIVFAVHMAEELPRFPAWASRHFGTTSLPWYVYSHVGLVLAGTGICAWASEAAPGSWPRILVMALMLTMALNGIFHVATTILFRAYSPGVVTGVCLFFPAAGVMVRAGLEAGHVSGLQLVLALALAAAVQAAVIASLYLPMDLDWRLRRVAPRT